MTRATSIASQDQRLYVGLIEGETIGGAQGKCALGKDAAMGETKPVLEDLTVQSTVLAEMEWSPDVDAAGVGVAVENGVVSLSGEVDTYAERVAAKRAAFRVHGVVAVVDHLVVHPNSRWELTDTDVAKEVEHALRAASNIPDSVKAEIANHAVVLVGHADWDFQRQAAKRAVQYLEGVYSVESRIALTARPSSAEAEETIVKALIRNAGLDANSIGVKVLGQSVTLTGTVKSWAEKQHAGRIAWASPAVTEVDNSIVVQG